MMQYADKALDFIAQKVSNVLIGVLFAVNEALADFGGED